MEYKICGPPAQLEELVQCYWSLRSYPDNPVPRDYFLMADNCPEIIFQYDEGFEAYSAQSARMRFQHSIHDRFRVGTKIGFFGVRLHPHAVSTLLNIPATEVVNKVYDFADLFKQDGADVADKIYAAENFEQRVAFVSTFLIKKSKHQKFDAIRYSVNSLFRTGGAMDILALQGESGLSLRQFERRFKSVTGFTPKYFARTSRFQSVKDSFCVNGEMTMTSLAYSRNYFDQAHFNREFKEFAGVNPLEYFKVHRQKLNDGQKTNLNFQGNPATKFAGYLPCGWFI